MRLRTVIFVLAGLLAILAFVSSAGMGPAQPSPADPLTGAAVQVLPPAINFQGRLLDPATGLPRPDGSYPMAFNLYAVSTGGTPVWTEAKSVTVNRGLFATLLGDTVALNPALFSGQDLWLGITVGADPEALPRQRLAYVPYAFYAQTAQNAGALDGLDSSAFAATAHGHTGGDIVDGSISAADLATALPKAKYISLDPYAAFIGGSAFFDNGFGPYGGLHLPKGTTYASFALGFTLPPDFTTAGAINVETVWNTASTGCTIRLSGNAITVARPGRQHIVGGTTATGITVVGGENLTAPSTLNQSARTVIAITSPDGVTPLQAGDAILFGLYRPSGIDTCTTDLVLQSFLVRYD